MVTPAQADRLILEHLPSWPREDCPLELAHGRVLRAPILADRDLPPYDRVTLDGFAVRTASLKAGLRNFRVEAVQAAGMIPVPLGQAPDAAVEIMTGAVLPSGADCVIPYEDATREGSLVTVTGAADHAAGFAIHGRGTDHRAGEVIVPAGTRLTGREIAVAAACGCTNLTVTRMPKIAVIATGDELVDVDTPVAAHQIRRSNDYAIRAALELAGFQRIDRYHLRDMRHEIEQLLWRVLAEHDVVIITGGVSKGKFDFLPEELEKQKVRKLFAGVSQRPGKPFWFGSSSRSTPIFALPGNPVATYVCLHRYVLPALKRASGRPAEPAQYAALATPYHFRPKLTCLLPVKYASTPEGELKATPLPSNTSGDFAGLVGTDGFLELPADKEDFPAGFTAPAFHWT